MGLKKKIIISIAVFLLVAVAAVAIVLYAPLPMHIDWDSVYDVESNVERLAPGEKENFTDAPALVKRNADGSVDTSDWKVLQFTDMHLSETNKGDLGNDRTMREFIAAIERERPDFVVLTGDIITSIRGKARTVQLCEVMEKLGVYWAYNLGNHEGDAFYKYPRTSVMKIIEKYPHCLSEGSVKKTAAGESVWGTGNFVVNLLGDRKVAQSMIFLDSGNEMTEQEIKELGIDTKTQRVDNFLKESQIKWYEEQVRKVNTDPASPVKTMLFIHIPLVEQRNLTFVTADESGEIKLPDEEGEWSFVEGVAAKDHDGKVVGKDALKSGWNVVAGTANFEGVCASGYNSGMYQMMCSLRPYVNGVFCGHDHTNDSILYETPAAGENPIYLTYGICSGYATYNLYGKNKSDDPVNLKKGYSVITVHGNGSFDFSGVSYDYNYKVSKYIVNGLPCQG